MLRALKWMLILGLGAICLAQQPQPARTAVSIKDMAFNPAKVQIKTGDTVVWTNNDDRDHTVVASKGPFKSDNLRPNATYSYQFTKAGTFTYGCSYHPRMAGTVIVTDK